MEKDYLSDKNHVRGKTLLWVREDFSVRFNFKFIFKLFFPFSALIFIVIVL
jgi:hypothetical protein